MTKSLGKPTASGYYKTDKGIPSIRFYLGKDKREAQIRKLRIDQLWDCVVAHKGEWDELTKAIGQAIGKGETTILVTDLGGLGSFAEMHRIANLQQRYPVIKFISPNEEILKEERESYTQQLQEEAATLGHNPHTLYCAIDTFAQVQEQSHLDPETKEPTEYAGQIVRRLNRIKDNTDDCQLNQFGQDAIDAILTTWRNRPLTKRRKISSRDECSDVIGTFRAFIEWLNGRFKWKRPETYRVRPIRIPETREERGRHKTPTYKKAELKILWEAATPLERVLIALGLNCGFGAAEIATLTLDELGSTLNPSHIKRVRRKTRVYGEWTLWPESREAIMWALRRRPNSDLPELLLTSKGTTYYQLTKGKNANQKIRNIWSSLLARVLKAHPDFRRLSFKYLRKTSGNYIRQKFGGELMRTFHSRGRPVESDDQSERYSNRRFRRLAEATTRMRKVLSDVFCVESPFFDELRKPQISVEVRKKVKELRHGKKYSYKQICDELGISKDSVYRILKKA